MRFLNLTAILLLFSFSSLVFLPNIIKAQTDQLTSRSTEQRILFLNQVRGEECCDPGHLEHLQLQLSTFQKHQLPANFAIRYDALTDSRYISLIKNFQTGLRSPTSDLGIFLEITPSLAKASGVQYNTNEQVSRPSLEGRTPSLRNEDMAGGVENKEDLSKWYEAQHVYPLGYSLEDRKKLVDTAFAEFRKQFGTTPSFTVGWIVDTPTLNYIREKYGVTVHQITREQWGTDSYTLDGGPVHYPYLGNKNWSFLPSTDQPTTDQSTLILRQTISDPLFNYGDSTSAFTSQPNDYSRDGKDFDYYKKLLDQVLSQSTGSSLSLGENPGNPGSEGNEPANLPTNQPINQYSIAILGLENSMAEEYQQEYVRQIEYVASLLRERPPNPPTSGMASEENEPTNRSDLLTTSLQVQTIPQFDSEYRQKWATQQITAIKGEDLIYGSNNETIWINAPNYRVRVLKKENQLVISDLRLYNQEWKDPYTEYSAQNLGFWVAPFLIAGNRFYQPTTNHPINRLTKIKDKVKEQILPEYKNRPPELLEIKNDLNTDPTGIYLPSLEGRTSSQRNEDTRGGVQLARQPDSSIQLTYTDQNNQPVTLTFYPDHFELQSTDQPTTDQLTTDQLPFIQANSNSIQWKDKDEQVFLELKIDCTKTEQLTTCVFRPSSDSNLFSSVSQQFYPYLFPEVIDRPLDNQQTILYAHNQYAIAGRNPVRFVLIPKDEQGYATTQQVEPNISTEPKVLDISIQDQQSNGVIFMDVIENRVGKYEVKVKVGDQIEKTETIYFAPDCKVEKWRCLRNPQYGIWYLMSNFYAKLRTF